MTPLCDEAAERAVLDVIVVRNSAVDEIAETLRPDHFGRHHLGRVYEAALKLHATNRPIDYFTLVDQLERDGNLKDVGKAFVMSLGSGIPQSSNVMAYAAIVIDKATLRAVRTAGMAMVAASEADNADGGSVLTDAEAAVYRLAHAHVKSEWVSGAALAEELYPVIEQLASGGAVVGVPSGFAGLDTLTRGFQKGDLIIIGARPSAGKTAFALQVALSASVVRQDGPRTAPVAFLSVEMSRQPLGLRGVVSLAQVDGWRLLAGHPGESDLKKAGVGLAELSQRAIYVDESPILSPLTLRSKLRKLVSQAGPLGLVVIDYLQLMAPMPEDMRGSRENKVAGISRNLKLLAREFDTPFIVLSQLNRLLEARADKRPNLSDLRESGALEQDADVVLFVHRPEVYDPKPENEGIAEIIIGKQRNGPTGSLLLTWRKEQMRFEDHYRS